MSPISSHDDPNVRPIVRTAPQGNRSLWLFAAILLLGASVLFEALNARRQSLTEPNTQMAPYNGGMVTAPQPLSLPPQFQSGIQEAPVAPVPPASGLRSISAPPSASVPRIAPAAPAAQPIVSRMVEHPAPLLNPLPPAPPASAPQATVIQSPLRQEGDFGGGTVPAAEAKAAPPNERILAGRLANPALTVPQGTVIAAVLETALDSTRPGAVRAIVQRDIMGFDGTRVLIPRGSRLYGEYTADVGAGQNRALIRWTRLTRPDAVVINLDSPSADPLGRAGVEGKVNSHFFERFGSAILQSVLDMGAGLANSAAFSHGVYVALPTPVQAQPNVLQSQEVKRTLKVRQGTSVSVFVARDLDFSSVDK